MFWHRFRRWWTDWGCWVIAAMGSRDPLTVRTLAMEPLEPRLTLAAAGLTDVGTQPAGSLSGKIAYIHGGHGYTTVNNGASNAFWAYQRPLLLGMVEDLGNQDQMTMLADYLWRAGATVVPLRPVGHQPHEVVLDNDDPRVTFTGAWRNSTASIYFGSAGDVPYRYASTSSAETAVARYQPQLPAAGFYPVYAWTRAGSDRASDQLYRVNHAGGSTEVTVNHRRVGNGLIYLGTYYFHAGAGGSVEISNRSSEPGRVVIADMIRFGNGVSDVDRGAGRSGLSREDETGLYWVEWHAQRSQGVPESAYRTSSNDSTASVSFSPRYAAYMNREADGALADRVFVSFHSNAATGSARGMLGLYNGNNDPATATPNQLLLARTLAQEANNDLVALNGQFEHAWFDRGSGLVLDRSDIEFGEINNLRIDGEFDATILETGFHDNRQDAEMLRDPRVRDAIARATYQGMVRYFRAVDGGATPLVMAPSTVSHVRAEPTGEGQITVSWRAPVASGALGDAATGYRVYASIDGYGFDGGRYVAGGTATSLTLAGLDSEQGPYFFRVAAVNAGGESPLSEAAAATPRVDGARVLVVQGFDRLDRTQNPLQTVRGSGSAERVRPLWSNARDYVVPVAQSLSRTSARLVVSSAANETVAAGAVRLQDYDAVFWLLGEESTNDATFDENEQQRVAAYLAQGGKLLVSGAEVAWDLDAQNQGRDFLRNVLRTQYVADDANTYSVRGVAGSQFAGVSFNFDNGARFYDVNYPDVLAPAEGASLALAYATGGGAAVAYVDAATAARSLVFGFPIETLVDAAQRDALVAGAVEFLQVPLATADFDRNGQIDGRDFLTWQRGFGQQPRGSVEGDANGDGRVDAADRAIWELQWGPDNTFSPAAAARAPSDSQADVASEADEPAPQGASDEPQTLWAPPGGASALLARALADASGEGLPRQASFAPYREVLRGGGGLLANHGPSVSAPRHDAAGQAVGQPAKPAGLNSEVSTADIRRKLGDTTWATEGEFLSRRVDSTATEQSAQKDEIFAQKK